MWKNDCYEILVWTAGSEGRFLEWKKGIWQVFEHWNYRHSFEKSEITKKDIETLRQHFNISDSDIPDTELLKLTPDELAHVSERVKR